LQEVLDGKPGCLLYSPPVAVPLHSLAAAEALYTQSIPEPSTWAMMLVGFAGLALRAIGCREKPIVDVARLRLGELVSVVSKSVSLASPCFSMSLKTT
jgi:hypothetical protein